MARLRHIAIATKDPEKTAAFYQKVFGLQFVKRVPTSPRGGGVFLTDGHINFAFLDFPTDEAATKLLYLALRNILAKWQRGNHAWRAAMPHLSMLFGPRFTDHA